MLTFKNLMLAAGIFALLSMGVLVLQVAQEMQVPQLSNPVDNATFVSAYVGSENTYFGPTWSAVFMAIGEHDVDEVLVEAPNFYFWEKEVTIKVTDLKTKQVLQSDKVAVGKTYTVVTSDGGEYKITPVSGGYHFLCNGIPRVVPPDPPIEEEEQ